MHLHLIDRKTAIAAGLKRFFDGTPCSMGEIGERLTSNGRCFCEKHRKVISESAKAWHGRKAAVKLQQLEISDEMRLNLHLISRDTARRHGLKHYFTGLPCAHNRIATRLTCNRRCRCQCCRADDAARSNKNHHAKRKIKLSKMREYYATNKERENSRAKAWKDANRERIAAYQRSVSDKRSTAESMRRARKQNASPPWFGEFDLFVLEEAFSLCIERQKETGIDWHVDHMIPLQAKKACGLHVWNNIQVIPATINVRKHNRMLLTEPLEWIK